MGRKVLSGVLAVVASCVSLAASADDLSYQGFVHSDKRIKCLYGYAATKTGDHAAAMQIFNDCIARWNDVYSMIWLAQMYESGSGVPKDLGKAAALIKRGAEQPDGTAYASLARYHWGVALWEGVGVDPDPDQARTWLERAAAEGQTEAMDYLRQRAD
jgi:TPR repeat protein